VRFGVYEVTGKRPYRGHEPGTVFEALLDVGPEQRAIARGDIKLLRYETPDLVPENRTFPDGWLRPPGEPAAEAHSEAPTGASSV